MASHVKNCALAGLLNGTIDLDSNDMRVRLAMTNTTYDTETDSIAFIVDFTTDDIHDGANYVDKALASETVTKNDTSDRGDFSANNLTWTALGAGTRNIAGALLYKFVTNDSDSIPVAWIEFSAASDGNDFVVRWNSGSSAGDILRLANA